MGDSLQPNSFEGFIGQEKPKKVLQILCAAAKRKGTCLPSLLLLGPPGTGKSLLARILGAELNCPVQEVICGNIATPEQMAKQLLQLKAGSILMLDEGHALNRQTEEILYGALQDGRISVVQSGYDDMMKGLGLGKKQPKATMVELPPFTCVMATTLAGLISDPLRSRFSQVLQLEPYSDEDLAKIILNAAAKMNFALPAAIAMEVARRSRATARTALSNLKWLAEYCDGVGIPPNETAIKDAFELKEISPDGLTKADMAYLTTLVEAGEPLGLSTLAAATGENEETLSQAIEPFLLRNGYVRKGPRGRVATDKAVEMVNGKAA